MTADLAGVVSHLPGDLLLGRGDLSSAIIWSLLVILWQVIDEDEEKALITVPKMASAHSDCLKASHIHGTSIR